MSKIGILKSKTSFLFVNNIVEIKEGASLGYFMVRLIGEKEFIEVKGSYKHFIENYCEDLKSFSSK